MGRRKGFQSANGDAAIFSAAIEQALIKQELRLQIYSFVFDKTTRLLVEKCWQDSDALYASLIKLRRDERHVEFGQEEGPWVSEHLEEAIFRALEWTQSHGFTIRGVRRKPGPNEVMSEFIYELTSDRRYRKAVSTAKGKQEPRAVKELPLTAKYAISLAEIAENLFKLPAKATKDINEIQKLASSLAEALRRDHTAILQEAMKASQMTKPNPAFNGDVNIFRDLYNIKHNPKTLFVIYLTEPLPQHHLALAQTNHFYRTDSLPVLASSPIYDFNDNLSLSTTLNPCSLVHLNQVRVTFVEGYIPTLPLESWPNIRVLHVELWPRDPARIDASNRAWGEQTLALLDNISQLKVKVVGGFDAAHPDSRDEYGD